MISWLGLSKVFCKFAAFALIAIQECSVHCGRLRHFATSRASGQSQIQPEIGAYSKQFKLHSFLAAGGQADVWIGFDLKADRSVVMRFPRSLCEDGPGRCLMRELDSETVEEWRQGCMIARAAKARHEVKLQQGAALTRYRVFSDCIMPLSSNPDDPAFEVWSYDGGLTLAEAFFTNTSHGLSMADKRDIIRTLKNAVGLMTDPDLSQSLTCCCPDNKLMMERSEPCILDHGCPWKYRKSSPDACGPLVHHDIKFDNIVLLSHEGRLLPRIIDFGAAVHCSQGRSLSFSKDWAPHWLSDPTFFSTTECWAYDTYSLGLMWLVVELLAQLPNEQLACDAGVELGLGDQRCLQVQSPLDSHTLERALLPVQLLVSDLHAYFVSNPFEASFDLFHEILEKFINSPEFRSKEARRLKLVLPPSEYLGAIFTMVLKCPSFPGSPNIWLEGTFLGDRATCFFFNAVNELQSGIAIPDSNRLPMLLENMQIACGTIEQLLENYTLIEKVSNRFQGWSTEDFRRSCHTHLTPALIKMISADDAEGIARVLLSDAAEDSEIDSNMLLANGEHILATAGRARSTSVVRLLLTQGARVLTPAHTCQSQKDKEVFLPLPPLLAAATRDDNAEVLQLLLHAAEAEEGLLLGQLATLFAYKTQRNKFEGPSLVSTLAQVGDSRMLSMVLQKLQNEPQLVPLAVKGMDYGDVPLVQAALGGHAEICSLLLQAGADPKQTNSEGETALCKAVSFGDVRTVRVLGEASRHTVNMPCAGSTPLHLAVAELRGSAGNAAVVDALIELKADQEALDHARETALHKAVRISKDVDIVKKLAASAEAQMALNSKGQTPLADAAGACRSLDIFNAVLDKAPQAALQKQDARCRTPLMRAAAHGQIDCLRALASRSSVHFKCANGDDAVSAAMALRERRAAEVLVWEFGADSTLLRYGGDRVGMVVLTSPSH